MSDVNGTYDDAQPPYSGDTYEAGGGYDEPAEIYTLASWGKRAAAASVDYGVFYLIFLVFLGLSEATGVQLLARVGGLIGLGYLAWTYVWDFGRTGRTVGKRLVNIKLVSRRDARPIGVLAVLTRHILHILDSSFCFLGYLLPLVDAKRQTIADKLLNTAVIEAPRGLMRR